MARQRQIQFTIPEPCNIPWNGMKPVDKDQRYCSSCEKVVMDFSKMSDDELMLYFRHNNGKICGRLSNSQMNRSMMLLPDQTQKAKWWRTLILIPLTLFGKSAKAQNDSVPYANHPKDTNALSLQKDSIDNDSLSKQNIAEQDSLIQDSLPIKIAVDETDTSKAICVPKFVWINPKTITVFAYPVSSGGCVVPVCYPISEIQYPILSALLDTIVPFRKKENDDSVSEQINNPEPFREVSQQPKQKPKPQQPALPASNELTGILPEERKKFWRS